MTPGEGRSPRRHPPPTPPHRIGLQPVCESLETGWILIFVEIVKVAGRILSFNVNNILVRFPNCIVHYQGRGWGT